ncbi:MAG: hypothetical protein B5M53_08915 [Candidatus Cloacimonas sp. 4484_209]|nr:MAG: hypothetical protein B5M53_08915 [Candidatus Cloacimonas sp. 4484_209]
MFTLLFNRIKIALRSLFVKKQQNVVRILSYAVVIIIFLFGGGFVFYRIFLYLNTVEIIGPLLAKRIISLSFLIFLALIFLSSIITGLSTFFRTKEVEYLITLPLSIEKVFLLRFLENTFYASWATIIGAIPIIFAFGLVQGYHILFYPISVLGLIFFIVIPSAAGTIVLMIITSIMGNITRRRLIYIVLILVAVILMGFFISRPSILRVPLTADLNKVNAYVESLKVENSYLPSAFLVKFITKPFSSSSTRYFLLLFTTSVFLFTLSYGISSALYTRNWNNVISSATNSGRKNSNLLYIFFSRLGLSSTIVSLMVKDIRMFMRLPAQWGQALIFLILLLSYVISLKRTPYYFNAPYWIAVISFINLGFTGYIVATLSTRFVYPAVSLEGKSIGFIFTAPVKIKDFFTEKFIISFIPNLLLAEFIVIFSNVFLKSNVAFTLICSGITAVFTLTVVAISVGMGAVFPDFTETNPSKIAAGGGGVFTAIISLFYVGLAIAIISVPTRRFITSQLQLGAFHTHSFIPYVILFLFLSFLFAVFPLRFGMKHLRQLEI